MEAGFLYYPRQLVRMSVGAWTGLWENGCGRGVQEMKLQRGKAVAWTW